MTWAYYNDNEPYVCEWLRNLIAAGHLPDGEVDDRSILDVQPEDLRGFSWVNLFAGIGGWPLALMQAGWPRERPVWTASFPCQPFSNAGKRQGEADERHLWPVGLRLIRECRPDTIFGEQVAGAVGMGWLDRVFADLEEEGYACGALVLGAHSVGAPHIRQRLWWVADANSEQRRSTPRQPNTGYDGRHDARWSGKDGGVAHTMRSGQPGQGQLVRSGDTAAREDRQEHRVVDAGGSGHWQSTWHPCADGKTRRIPIESALFPLAPRLPGRVGQLRAAGNAIVPQVAAEFVRAFMEATRPHDSKADAYQSWLAWLAYKREQLKRKPAEQLTLTERGE